MTKKAPTTVAVETEEIAPFMSQQILHELALMRKDMEGLRKDVQNVETGLKKDIEGVETRLNARMDKMEGKVEGEIKALRGEFRGVYFWSSFVAAACIGTIITVLLRS